MCWCTNLRKAAIIQGTFIQFFSLEINKGSKKNGYFCRCFGKNFQIHIIFKFMSKVTVVGAGNVGATCALMYLAHKDIVNEVVLIDIKGDLARGKALDSWQQAPIDYYSTQLLRYGRL